MPGNTSSKRATFDSLFEILCGPSVSDGKLGATSTAGNPTLIAQYATPNANRTNSSAAPTVVYSSGPANAASGDVVYSSLPPAAAAADESPYGFSAASGGVDPSALYATPRQRGKAATTAAAAEEDQYEVGPGAMAPGVSATYDLVPAQMSTTAPLDVQVVMAPGAALWRHPLDRAGAEATLSAAAAADATVVRWLARPKGTDTVLSVLIPSKSQFFHDKIIARPDGTFVCGAAQAKPAPSMLALSSRVAETLRSKFNGSSAEPVLRGVDRGNDEVFASYA